MQSNKPLPAAANLPRGQLASLLRDHDDIVEYSPYRKIGSLSAPFMADMNQRAGSAPPSLFSEGFPHNNDCYWQDDAKYAVFYHEQSRLPPSRFAPGQSWKTLSRPHSHFSGNGIALRDLHFTDIGYNSASGLISHQDMIERNNVPSLRSSIDRSFSSDIIDRRLLLHTPPPSHTLSGICVPPDICRPSSTPPCLLKPKLSCTKPPGEKNHVFVDSFSVLQISDYDLVSFNESCSEGSGENESAVAYNLSLSLILNRLRKQNSEKIDLKDICGYIADISRDQFGSRFIQKTIGLGEMAFACIFDELKPTILSLMTDTYGNYVVQKLFEHGKGHRLSQLFEHLRGQILALFTNLYGCRVIQSAFETADNHQRISMINEINGHVVRCVKDQNGNHVLQRAFDRIPSRHLQFVFDEIESEIESLAKHPYGCRVVQKMLDFGSENQKAQLMCRLISNSSMIIRDQYGNYVIQHILRVGRPTEKSAIIKNVSGQLLELSRHKFASNVVEKCLIYGSDQDRDQIIKQSLQVSSPKNETSVLVEMMKDKFANYVVQRMIEQCNVRQRKILIGHILPLVEQLKRFTYGKHIVSKIEKLS